jgi:hypothetical protein
VGGRNMQGRGDEEMGDLGQMHQRYTFATAKQGLGDLVCDGDQKCPGSKDGACDRKAETTCPKQYQQGRDDLCDQSVQVGQNNTDKEETTCAINLFKLVKKILTRTKEETTCAINLFKLV